MGRVCLLKESPSRERFITASEEKKLLVRLKGRRDHIRSPVTIALNTGMRRGEILRAIVGTRESSSKFRSPEARPAEPGPS